MMGTFACDVATAVELAGKDEPSSPPPGFQYKGYKLLKVK